ncbi:MAG: hypothetical protein N2692_02045 [Patescibacteria group bacterium]|nr:hypothetical protein [Patescibacteria group bacterium]
MILKYSDLNKEEQDILIRAKEARKLFVLFSTAEAGVTLKISDGRIMTHGNLDPTALYPSLNAILVLIKNIRKNDKIEKIAIVSNESKEVWETAIYVLKRFLKERCENAEIFISNPTLEIINKYKLTI